MKLWKIIALIMIIPLSIVSCGDDDDELTPDPPKQETTLTASPSQITLMSEKGSSSSFTITCSADWTLTCDSSWLMTSASKGTGNASITITALSMNDSSADREATISIESNDVVQKVMITQIGAYVAGCSVGFEQTLCLINSIAFKFKCGSNVNYFYAGFLEASAAGWTDDRIAEELSSNRFDPKNSDDLYGFGGLATNTTYYLCALAFDSKGNRGELTKLAITTPSAKDSDPWAYISELGYDNDYFYWKTTPDSYTSKYFMLAQEGSAARNMAYLTDAEVAWILRYNIEQDLVKPLAREGDWQLARSSGSTDIYIATWGVSIENTYSNQLNSGLWSINESYANYAPKKIKGENKNGPVVLNSISNEELNRLKDNVRVYEYK